MSPTLDESLIEGAQVADVTEWLASLGWRRDPDFPRAELLVFEGPGDDDGTPITAVIPSDVSSTDFRDRLIDLVKLVAAATGRTPNEAAADLAAADADRVQVRVLSNFAHRGSIPLDYAAGMIVALRELVVAAACVEENPRASYTRATKAAVEHARRCRFGQTRRGSFVATLECPVTPVIGDPTAPSAVPFERRVTERIVRGVGNVHRAALDGRAEALVTQWKDGLNANMCESLLRLRDPDGETTLEFSTHWSRRLAAPADLGRSVRIDRTGFEFVAATSRALRSTVAHDARAFIGRVVALADPREDDDDGVDDDDDDRIATLRFDANGRGRLQNARARLGEGDYKLACDAHRDGRPVSLRGRLERRGNRWWITDTEGFAFALA